jgi:hypothetical protein
MIDWAENLVPVLGVRAGTHVLAAEQTCSALALHSTLQITKMAVGRLRPDFLDRCKPVVPSPLIVSYGLPASANPACTEPESVELTDGHYR